MLNLQDTGVIIASPEHIRSVIAQGVREGMRQAMADAARGENLRENDAADFIGVAPRTLREWRNDGRGPAFVQYGECGRVMYRRKDLEAFMERNRKETISTVVFPG